MLRSFLKNSAPQAAYIIAVPLKTLKAPFAKCTKHFLPFPQLFLVEPGGCLHIGEPHACHTDPPGSEQGLSPLVDSRAKRKNAQRNWLVPKPLIFPIYNFGIYLTIKMSLPVELIGVLSK